MVKKVRFDDIVKINQMPINLTDHIKEVKSPGDIIINPDKITLGGLSPPNLNSAAPSTVTSLAPITVEGITVEGITVGDDNKLWSWIISAVVLVLLVALALAYYLLH